jgi:Fe-S-cluster formation regulator IscX/YfhJ
MSTREIAGHLLDIYGVEVSPDLISTVTDAVLDEIATWQAQNEGAKFWLRVMNELKNRGVEDVLLAVVDGLKGFPEAIVAVFPEATVQTCIVHLLRHSLDLVSWKDRKAVAAALKDIYRAVDPAAAEVVNRPANGALTHFRCSSTRFGEHVSEGARHASWIIPVGLACWAFHRGVTAESDRLLITARPTVLDAACPECGRRSRQVHSRYERRLMDLPSHGRIVHLRVEVRRFDAPTSPAQGEYSVSLSPRAWHLGRRGARQGSRASCIISGLPWVEDLRRIWRDASCCQ